MSPRHARTPARGMVHFYTVTMTAGVLGISEAEVVKMLENGELRGLRLVPPTPWLVDGKTLDEFALHLRNSPPQSDERRASGPVQQRRLRVKLRKDQA